MTSAKELDAWVARATAKGLICVDTETTSLDPMQAGLCGVSLAVAPGEACYIPCGHRRGEGLQLDGNEKILQMTEEDVIARLKPLLEDPSVFTGRAESQNMTPWSFSSAVYGSIPSTTQC